MQHLTVLTTVAVDALQLKPHDVVLDATHGSGGHTREIARRLEIPGRVIAVDIDPSAISAATTWTETSVVPIQLIQSDFRLVAEHIPAQSVDAALADLGWRTEQFTEAGRGFSFRADEPLYMTFGDPDTYAFTAKDIVNDWSEESIANVIKGYGEERFAKRIAQRIVETRHHTPIVTAQQLGAIISEAIPKRFHSSRIHPATKTFQALRIAVNDELSAVDEFISNVWPLLVPGGRLAIISFHSLEDRIVKHRFRQYVQAGVGELLHKRPITADAEECSNNPRARSAKLRTIKKL